MSEQGGNHKVMNPSFEQTSRECVTQIIWPQIFDAGPGAGGGKAFLDRLNRLIFAIGKQPLAGSCVLKQDPEDVLCRVV